MPSPRAPTQRCRSPRPGGSTSSLRAALLGALLVLGVVLIGATLTRSPATTASSAPSPDASSTPASVAATAAPTTTAPATTAPAIAGPTTTVPTTTVPTTTVPKTTVPGAVSGPVGVLGAAGGCGLSLVARVTAAVGHCTVLEIGDSLGNDLGWGLRRELAAASGLDLVQLDKSASGLANTGFYNWPAQLGADLRRYRPQLVVASLGGDDEQGMNVGGSAVQFGTAAWSAAYSARVRHLISEATASGAYLLWVGLPVMQPPYYDRGVALLDSLFRQAVASEPDATYVSTAALFSNPQGAFQSSAFVNGQPAALRQSDGIHYSFVGEDVLATYVIREMALIYHVTLAATNPAVITGW